MKPQQSSRLHNELSAIKSNIVSLAQSLDCEEFDVTQKIIMLDQLASMSTYAKALSLRIKFLELGDDD